ncbi:MAG: hypothetical protein AAGD25_36840 [Cyanobacteria bacterium P01_F01_bin.150]
MKSHQIKPLYRKVNTKARGMRHHNGSDYRHFRNRKEKHLVKMAQGVQRGLDYTPLFMFLLSKVGQSWDVVFSEAVSRLDKQEPIFWLVSLSKEHAPPTVRLGESSYYSGLYVDEAGILQKVAPELNASSLTPLCACCTHTFNGKPFSQKYRLS